MKASRRLYAWALILPTILVLLVVVVYPLVYSLNVAFRNADLRMRLNPGEDYPFIGLGNFLRIFDDSRFHDALLRTAYYIGLGIAIQLGAGLGVAILLFSLTKRRALVTALILPSMVIPVAVGWTGRLLFHPTAGPVNYILSLMGVEGIGWVNSAQYSLLTLILIDSWQWTPFIMLITYAGLLSLPQEVVESAKVDGASGLRLFIHIILPLLKPVLLVAILIRVLEMLRAFDVVYVLTYGGPGTSSEIVTFYAFIAGFRYFELGYSAAMGWIIVILLSVILTLLVRVIRA